MTLSVKSFVNLIVIITLALGLTACGTSGPNQNVVASAIGLQVQAVQTQLSQTLKLKPPTLDQIAIRHVDIQAIEPLTVDREPGYHLTGRYDMGLQQSDHQASQSGNTFDLYLQQHTIGTGKAQKQVWQLATPGENESWQMQALNVK
jgi:predicted small lipoprotein YifL